MERARLRMPVGGGAALRAIVAVQAAARASLTDVASAPRGVTGAWREHRSALMARAAVGAVGRHGELYEE
jgi:hypothetical protein